MSHVKSCVTTPNSKSGQRTFSAKALRQSILAFKPDNFNRVRGKYFSTKFINLHIRVRACECIFKTSLCKTNTEKETLILSTHKNWLLFIIALLKKFIWKRY